MGGADTVSRGFLVALDYVLPILARVGCQALLANPFQGRYVLDTLISIK